MAEQPRKLTQPQFFKLCDHLRSSKEQIESESFSLKQLATFAENNLKFPVSPVSAKAALAALGDEAPNIRKQEKSSDTAINTLRQAVYRLRRAVRQIASKHPPLLREVNDILNGTLPLETGDD